MRDLAGVTVACIDTANHALALRALEQSRRGLRFERTLLLTDALPAGVHAPAGVDIVGIARLASRDDYSRFVLKSLLPHIGTPYVLLIQWDGYVVNPSAFDPSFLDCDYLGAKWFWYDDGMRVGNGGFSLRSRKLLGALQDPRVILRDAEDTTICRTFRALLEADYGIRFGSEVLVDRFAFEAAYPSGMPFGFHGLYNFCRVMPPAELAALAALFSDAIARSLQLGQLLRNCVALGQWDAAAALAQRRLAAAPGDTEAQSLLARAEAGAARGPTVGRNDPCPCGSGKRYKQCHGAIASATAADASRTGSTPTQQGSATPTAATLTQQGMAAHQRGAIDEAERAYDAALRIEAEHPLALHYLGVIAYQRGRHADALPLLERSASLVPHEPEFHNNLGLALAALDRNDDAVAAYRRALDRKPGHATAWNNLGLVLQAANRLPEAIAAFRSALANAPSFAHAHWNLALALLAKGEYTEGWREYEWRLRLPELGGRLPALPVPRWNGQDLAGRTLLVTTEQGLGDALQFIRFAAPLAERSIRVVVRAPATLGPLLATAPGVTATVAVGEPLPACDAEIPLLSLPLMLGTHAAGIVTGVPYLRCDASLRTAAAAAVARAAGGTFSIGVAWAGAAHHLNDRRRSMPLAVLAPLFSMAGVTWFSLQKGPREHEVSDVAEARNLIRLDPQSDLSHTAALIDALDAVVSVDTSVAHLAGALGKPLWLLLPFAADWRWGIAGDHTPWYPAARLLRQSAIGDWRGVVGRLQDAIDSARTRPYPHIGP